MLRIPAPTLRRIAELIFEAVGSPPSEASIIAESLVESDLAGIHSHGVMRIPYYVKAVEEGRVKPGAKITVVKETEATALIDGGWGFGQVVARRAAELAVEKAVKTRISAVAAFKMWHIGRLGEYTGYIAGRGLIGLGFCTARPSVAPYGGRVRRLSTAPVSIAAPSRRHLFLLDYATSIVAEGKLRLKYIAGEPIPEGWIISPEGKPSKNPADFYERNGALLPFGGHKGYALAMAVEILSGILPGAGFSCSRSYLGGNNLLLIALDPEAFVGLEEFKAQVSEFMKTMKETPPAEGFTEVLVPGEPESRSREEKLREGVPLEEEVWARIKEVASKLNVDTSWFTSL